MPNQIQIGPMAGNDGTVINSRGDSYGSTMVQEFNGKYAELARRGQLFVASTASAGIAVLISATTGNVPTLWNPLGSGKILYPVRLAVNWLSGATTASALLWSTTTGAGANIGTAAPIATFTNVAPVPAMVGANSASNAKWAPAVCTFAAAPAFYASTGISLKAAAEDYVIYVDYDGTIALTPGTALSLTASVTTTTALLQASIWYAELPYSGN